MKRSSLLALSTIVLLACGGNSDTLDGESSGSGPASSGGASSSGGGPSSSGGASSSSSSSGGASSSSSSSGSTSGGADAGGTPLTPGDATLTLTAAGQQRSVLVHVPAAVKSGKVPLVIALHGNGDKNTNFVLTSGLKSLSDADGFVLAAPQGISQNINFMGTQLSGIDWDAYRSTSQGNIDMPLLDAIRSQLGASGSIDPKKVLVYGYSQGGYLSFRYGMDASASLSCAAVLAAADPLPGAGLVAGAARKIPVALQIGTNDFAIQNARATKQELEANGNPLQYNEIEGAGHVPIPGDPKVPLDFCRGQTLP